MLVLDTLKLVAAGRFPAVEDTPQMKSVVSPQTEKPSQPRLHQPVGALIEIMRRSLHRLLQRNLTDDEWSVFLTPKFGGADTIRQYTGWHELKPPQDRAWADPFVFERDGRTFVFVEEVSLRHAARIDRVLGMDPVRGASRRGCSRRAAPSFLTRFFSSTMGDLFMLPESSAAKELVLWRCIDFPL